MKIYLVENKSIPSNKVDPDFSKDLFYNRHYRRADAQKLEDYKDGILYFPTRWNGLNLSRCNIDILSNTYQKLMLIIFGIVYNTISETELNKLLSNYIPHIQKYVPDFKGFRFDRLDEVKIKNTITWLLIDYDKETEIYYETGDIVVWQFVYNSNINESKLIDIAFCERYTIITDANDNGNTIERLMEDGLIDTNVYNIYIFDDDETMKKLEV